VGNWKDKLKEAALKAGRAAQKDPRLLKAAENVKETIEAFQAGYREKLRPDGTRPPCPACGKPLPEEAKFCPACGVPIE